jgi:hypothetical protein
MHETLNGESFQFVVEERGDFGLVDSELNGDLSLGELLALDNSIERGAKSRFGLEFGGIGQTQIREDVPAAANYPILSHVIRSSPRYRVEQFSSAP